jgi:hypothetical protein
MSFDTTVGKFLTSDSSYLTDDIKAIATLVEGANTRTWDLFREGESAKSVTITWYDALSNSLQGAVGAATWSDGSTKTGLDVSATTSKIVNVGDVLLVEDEQVIVAAVDRTANTIDVVARGHGSTTGASHAAGKVIYIVGSAQVEGTVDGDSIIEDNEQNLNYVQLFQEPISWSRTSANQSYDDMTSLRVDAEKKAMSRMLKKLNLTALLGEPVARTGTTAGTAGGLSHYIINATGANTVSVGGSLSEDKLKTLLEAIASDGGQPNVLLCSPSDKAIINTWNLAANTAAATRTVTTRQDRGAGNIVDYYDSEALGRLEIIVDPLLMSTRGELYVLNTQKIARHWFVNDALRFEMEPSNSRSFAETLQGQCTFSIKDAGIDFGALYGITH